MRTTFERRFLAFLLLYPLAYGAFLYALPVPKTPEPPASPAKAPASRFRTTGASFALTNVRVFDGTDVLARATVVVKDGRIAAVGAGASAPAVPDGIAALDASELTLLPGFLDAHTHVWGEAPKDALAFGVTTEIDQFTDPNLLAPFRTAREGLANVREADVFSAGVLATAPGGHGTEYGLKIPTLTKPADADAWVAGRVAEGSDWIKIVLDDGKVWGRAIPSLDRATLAAVVKAAHVRGRKAVVHVSAQADATAALEAGADGLVHVFADVPVSDAFLALAKEKRAFVVATLAVVESIAGLGGPEAIKNDPDLAPFLLAGPRQMLGSAFPFSKKGEAFFATAVENVRRLKAAGVPILAGTDASNPGTAHGASLHREMELLVKAGLAPLEALRAATSAPANAFGIPERGVVAAGARANLVLVAGDPTADVRKTRAIVAIWKNGAFVPREVFDPSRKSAPLPEGPLGRFEDGTLKGGFGSGWQPTTDQMRGGTSTATAEVVAGGAKGSAKSLRIAGQVGAGFPYPWAGAMFLLGVPPFSPVDASGRKELVFQARGDGRAYRVMLFTTAGQIPSERVFNPTTDWTEIRMPLASFSGADPAGLRGVCFSADGTAGAFRLDVDEVELK